MNTKKFTALFLAIIMTLACLSACGLEDSDSSAKDTEWNVTDSSLASDLHDNYNYTGMIELTVDTHTSTNVKDSVSSGALTLNTSQRTISHGNLYTSYVTLPIQGDIHKDDTIIIRLALKNRSSAPSNFLLDVYNKGDNERNSWLTRNYVFTPSNSKYTDYYIYAVAQEDTDTAMLEINMGFANQTLSIDYIQAAMYPGTIRENLLEKLPLMSRSDANGNEVWHTYYGADEDWRNIAEQMIEENRKGQLNINVTDANGNPVKDATVKVEMTEHDYKFGSSTGANGFLGIGASAQLKGMQEYFNLLTFGNDLKWGQPGFDHLGRQENVYNALQFLAENNMDVHGHVLFWPGTDRDPYDDGVDNTAEFIVTPSFIVSTVRVMQAMQKMEDSSTGYGDGTIKTLRTEISNALEVYDETESLIKDNLTRQQVDSFRKLCEKLLDAIEKKADKETSLKGVSPTLKDFQKVLRQAVLDHVYDFASYYGETGAIIEWDVVNEIMNPGYRGVINAIGEDIFVEDSSKVCQDQIFIDIINVARKGAGEDVLLSYNDTQWQSNGQQRIDTYNFFKYLKDNNASINFLGLQAYFYPDSIRAQAEPIETWEEYDKLYELGIGTEVTEYSPSGFQSVIRDQERLNMFMADIMYDYILINFAHPGSIGFISWGGIPTSGAVSSVYYKLVFDKLWTHEELKTNEKGTATVNGFLGSYTITVTDVNGNVTTHTIEHTNSNVSGEHTVVNIKYK